MNRDSCFIFISPENFIKLLASSPVSRKLSYHRMFELNPLGLRYVREKLEQDAQVFIHNSVNMLETNHTRKVEDKILNDYLRLRTVAESFGLDFRTMVIDKGLHNWEKIRPILGTFSD